MVDKRKHPEYYAFPAVLEQDMDDGGVINVTFLILKTVLLMA